MFVEMMEVICWVALPYVVWRLVKAMRHFMDEINREDGHG